jgi:hypothetical protein
MDSKQPLTDRDGEVRELTDGDIRQFRPIAEIDPELMKVNEAPHPD